MNNDKAFRKALGQQQAELPLGFEERLTKRITLEADKKKLRNEYFNLALAGFVALAMIGGAYWALMHYFSFNLLGIFSGIDLRLEMNPLYIKCFGIALLVLLLLGLDMKLRQVVKRSGKT